jgi:hypothetical protein
MAKRWSVPKHWICAVLFLASCSGIVIFGSELQPDGPPSAPDPRPRSLKERLIPDRFPPQPTLTPFWSIPVDPIGFSPPGGIYLGARNSLASLDFIGEDKLLFTFRVPGLLRREGNQEQRRIRAVVLSLPQGTVDTETVWTVHDRRRYLWMLNDGHFLVRDRNNLLQGDSSLNLKPFLQFPGPLLWLELNPTQQLIVTDSLEPAGAPAKSGDVPSPSTAAATMDSDQTPTDQGADTVVRILRRDSGKVMLVSRVRTTVHLPVNADGYLEQLRSQGWNWVIDLTNFEGGSRQLVDLESHCDPTGDFVTEQEILLTTCTAEGNDKLTAVTTTGHSLWSDQVPAVAIWPEITIAPNGLRIARETLGVTHPVNSYNPIDSEDIKGQWVSVYDAATGDLALESPLNPPLDSGGNVAISPSGRRVALLNGGAIEVFVLPVPPKLGRNAEPPGR